MEGLYLIHTREFISTNKEIYKIGRSSNIENRVRNYPNGSKILLAIISRNSIQCEKDLIKKFKLTFTQKQFYGNEYFEGNKYKMVNMMCNYINIDNEECERKEEEEKAKEKKEKKGKKKEKKKEKGEEKKNDDEKKEEGNINSDKGNEEEIKDKKEEKTQLIKENKNKTECPKCNHIFKYPTMLRQHFKKSFHCLMDDEEIEKFFNPIIIKCDICNQTFIQKSSLYRHKRNVNCMFDLNNNNNSSISIKKQKKQKNTNSIKQINTININPFEYEDINKIPSLECKDFLKSILEGKLDNFTTIIPIIYSKLENKNFYKPKLSVYEIAIFHTNLTIKLYTYKDFINILFNHCILIIKKILFLYKTDFTINDIKLIINNLNTIINTKELYYKQIKLLIDTECINNNDTNKLNIKTITKNNKINTDDLTTYIKKCDEFNKDTETYINSILI